MIETFFFTGPSGWTIWKNRVFLPNKSLVNVHCAHAHIQQKHNLQVGIRVFCPGKKNRNDNDNACLGPGRTSYRQQTRKAGTPATQLSNAPISSARYLGAKLPISIPCSQGASDGQGAQDIVQPHDGTHCLPRQSVRMRSIQPIMNPGGSIQLREKL